MRITYIFILLAVVCGCDSDSPEYPKPASPAPQEPTDDTPEISHARAFEIDNAGVMLLSQKMLNAGQLRKLLWNQKTETTPPAAGPNAIQREVSAQGNQDTLSFTEAIHWSYAMAYSVETRHASDEIYISATINGMPEDSSPGSKAGPDALWGRGKARNAVVAKITEGAAPAGSEEVRAEAFQVTIETEQELPASIGFPIVAIKGYTSKQMKSGPKVSRFNFVDVNGKYLTTSDATKIPGRLFILPNIRVIEHSSFYSQLQIQRIAETSRVYGFPRPFFPFLQSDKRLNIAAISTEGQPVKRTMKRHLHTLYSALFADTGRKAFLGTCEVTYAYALAEGGPLTVQIPVLQARNSQIEGSDKSIADMTAKIAAECSAWFTENRHPSAGGEWQIVFRSYAELLLDDSNYLVLELNGLYFKAADVK